MIRLGIVLVIVLLVAFVGFLYLAYGNFEAPSTPVVKVMPDARFPK